MDPVTTPVASSERNSVMVPRPSLARRYSAGDALVAGRVEALGIADERRLGVRARTQPLSIVVLGDDPTLTGDLLGRVLGCDEAAGVERVDLVELGHQAGSSGVGAGVLERLHEQLGVDPSVQGEQVEGGLRVGLLR